MSATEMAEEWIAIAEAAGVTGLTQQNVFWLLGHYELSKPPLRVIGPHPDALLADLRERLIKEREDLHLTARAYAANSPAHAALIAEARGIRIALMCLDDTTKETGR